MIEKLVQELSPYKIIRHEKMPWFSQGEYQYVIGGSFALRAPGAQKAEQEHNHESAGRLAKMVDDYISGAMPERHGIPPLPPMEKTKCDNCGGTGYRSECPICGGRGEHECDDCGTYHTCGRCRGDGYVYASPDNGGKLCETCSGTGEYYIDLHCVEIGGKKFAARLLKPLVDAGAADCMISENGGVPAAVFFAGNVFGIVAETR